MSKPLPEHPSFCIIAPTAYIPQHAVLSDTHLCLAHLVDTDDEYTAMYYQASHDGDFVMMDCSAFELGESYPPEKLLELGKRCGADAIVLPDYPGQPAQVTIDAAEQWIPLFKEHGFKTFFVPQSKKGDLQDWIYAYQYAAQHPDIDIIGMSILGIPNALPNIAKPYARVVMSQLLEAQGIFAHDKHHHYLGLNSGPALEIPSLLRGGWLDTCDSSGPVWCGILGHEYSENTDSYLPVSKPKMEVDFNYHYMDCEKTHARIRNNVRMTLQLFESFR